MLTFSSLGLHHSSVSFVYKWHKNGPLMEQGEGQMGNVGLKDSTVPIHPFGRGLKT